MSIPPDEPTRPLAPAESPPPPRVREREVYAAEQEGSWLEELRDQVRSLRTAVVLLGVLSVVALGLAAWALLAADDQDEGASQAPRGASSARVSDLEDRIQRLESQAKNAPSNSDLDDVQSQQKDLADRIDKLESSSGQQDDAASQSSVDAIQQDLQDLDQRVDDVEQQQQQQQDEGGTTP